MESVTVTFLPHTCHSEWVVVYMANQVCNGSTFSYIIARQREKGYDDDAHFVLARQTY
jgi:hypothetical protein